MQAVDRPGGGRGRRATLKRRRGGGDELLAYKRGRRWVDLRSADINAWLKEATGEDVSAKDFRTWGATVLAAVALAVVRARRPRPRPARKRAITRAVKEVAHYLGNTPAVARASYIDPRVFDRYRDGETIDYRARGRRRRGDRERRRDRDPGPARGGRRSTLLEALGRRRPAGQAVASSASRASTASSRVGRIVKI